jgi:tetratricopeptide (TPR) repeat protein
MAWDLQSNFLIGSVIWDLVFFYYCHQGTLESGLAFLDGQLAQAQASGSPRLCGRIQLCRADVLALLGQTRSALTLAQAGQAEARLRGDTWLEQPVVASWVGHRQAELGEYAQARQTLQAAFDAQADPTQNPWAAGFVLEALAYVTLLEGDETQLQAALEQAQRAVTLLKMNAEGYGELTIGLNTAARLHLALGAAEAALETSTELMHWLDTVPGVPTPEQYLFTHSRALRALGRHEEADEVLHRAYERVMLVAGKTQDEALRQSWLENVRDNREIVAQWEARGERL